MGRPVQPLRRQAFKAIQTDFALPVVSRACRSPAGPRRGENWGHSGRFLPGSEPATGPHPGGLVTSRVRRPPAPLDPLGCTQQPLEGLLSFWRLGLRERQHKRHESQCGALLHVPQVSIPAQNAEAETGFPDIGRA